MEKHNEAAFDQAPAAALDDPWYDALASGWGEWDESQWVPENGPGTQLPPARVGEPGRIESVSGSGDDDVYLVVHASPEFQEVRSQYRRFVIPAALAFLGWYLAYVITATAAPGFMAREVAGVLNVALLAGLGQFATTFLLTWAYARHARLRRDSAAMDLRWDVTMQTHWETHQ